MENFSLTALDIKQYLCRLGLKRRAPTVDYLGQLIAAHKDRIPYENLETVCHHRPADIRPEAVRNKVLYHGRGGYCFELNCLFLYLLKALGYDARACGIKIGDPQGPVRHRGTLASVDGAVYFCDVGLGGRCPNTAVPLQEGIFPLEDFLISLTAAEDGVWEYRFTDSGKPQYIQTFPIAEGDFIPLNYYMTMTPGNFRDTVLVNRTRPDGFIRLAWPELTIQTGNTISRRTLRYAELPLVLREHFGLALAPEELPAETELMHYAAP